MARILLIENMKGLRRALAAKLKNAGHDVHEAEDGADGIELLKQSNYDLLITEMLLADKDGTEVLAFLETQPLRPPVIAMTGGNSQIPAELALLPAKTMATATLTKPVNEDQLVELIAKVLSKNGAASASPAS